MAEEEEIEWVVDQYIDRQDVCSSCGFEVVDVEEVNPKKEKNNGRY